MTQTPATQTAETSPLWLAIPGLDAEPSEAAMRALMAESLLRTIADADLSWGGTVEIPDAGFLAEIEPGELDLSF